MRRFIYTIAAATAVMSIAAAPAHAGTSSDPLGAKPAATHGTKTKSARTAHQRTLIVIGSSFWYRRK